MEQWDDMRLFLAVARSGTLSTAAHELRVGVSTLHRHLAAFEEQLGVKLFEKGPRGYVLSNAGEALLPKAEAVEEAIFSATRTVIGHDQNPTGDVRITLPLVLLPEIASHLTAFTKKCIRVRPILLADDVLLNLQGETDVALRATRSPPEQAVGRPLFDIGWARYASVDTAGDELGWIHYVDMEHSSAVIWRQKTFPKNAPTMRVRGVVAMKAVLAASGAQGLLPCFVGDEDPKLRRIGDVVAENKLWLLIHADLRRSARVRALVDFLVPRLKAEQARFLGQSCL